MNTFPAVRLARLCAVSLALAFAAANVRSQVVIGNGCDAMPLPLSYVGNAAAGTVLSIGQPLQPQWIGIIAIGAAQPTPLQIFDPNLFSCYTQLGQPAPVQIRVDPVAMYFFIGGGGVVNIPIPAGPAFLGLQLTAQEALGQALLRVTQAVTFTVQ